MTSLPPSIEPGLASRLESGDPVAWTRALVAIPSVNPEIEPGGPGEASIADFIAPHLEAWGYHVTRLEPVPGRPTLLARLGRSTGGLALCGHLDTVGVGGMRIAPFDPGLEDGRIQGRGSADMKAGVAAILAAAHAMARERPGASLAVVLTADEEHASLGLRHLLDSGFAAEGVVVTEPTSLALATANKGFLWITVEARGRAAHGSRPELGRDAIRQLARMIAALDALDEGGRGALRGEGGGPGEHPLLGAGSFHAGTIAGGDAPSVYPDRAGVTLEFRFLPGADTRDMVATVAAEARRIESLHPGVTLHVEPGLERPGADLPVRAPLVQALSASLRAEGVEPRIEGMTAWVESAWFMEAGIPSLCFGPGSIAQAHTDDEWVAVDEIEAAARVLVRLARSWPGAGGASA